MHQKLRHVQEEYAGDADRPLRGYLTTLAGYGGFVVVLVGIAVWRRRDLPARSSLGDTVLVSLATHKLSRLVAKDAVLSPLRAPVTRYAEAAGAGELNEQVLHGELRHSVGELISCPFCLNVWVATGFTVGLVLAPRFTQLVAGTLTAVAVSDTLQLVYDAAEQLPARANPDN